MRKSRGLERAGLRRWLAGLAGMAWAAPLVLVLAATPAAAATEQAPAVFQAIARVVVAPSGEATSIEPDPKLPEFLRDLVRKRIVAMRFEPATSVVGQASATTYLHFAGCIVADGDQARVALHYEANGPRPLPGPYPAAPNYPREAYTRGLEAEAKVIFIVQPDGSAALEDIDYIHTSSRNIWDRAIGEWVKTLRYAPEELDGVAIRTRIEMPVRFTLGNLPARRKKVEAPECLAASAGADDASRPVALDSPVRAIPSG